LLTKIINLVDNRRYYLDTSLKPDESPSKVINNQIKYFCSQTVFSTIKKFPNPLTTSNLDDVEFIERKDDREDETLVLKVVTKNGETYIQTGNMIGEFYFKSGNKPCQINIGLRFDKEENNNILEYLLNYANAVYPNKIELNPTKNKNKKKQNSIVKLLLSKMFSNSISKAFVMGLPTHYQEFNESGYNVRGKIDINRLVSKELPFKGITPYTRNEKIIEQNIGAILLKAIEIIEREYMPISVLSSIKSTLKQAGIKPIITPTTIQKAFRSRVLRNAIFSEYKNSLNLAIMIINGFQTPDFKNTNGVFYGYLTDISKIWENYLVKLLRTNISDEWEIEIEPEIKLFKDDEIKRLEPKLNKFINYMKPDIVLKHKTEKKVIVFDAKFKQSSWFNREDFYKTATYISYYQNQKYDVLLGGQIYPDVKADKINENLGFLDSDVDFRFMGIDLADRDNIKNNEQNFIEIIK